MTPLAIRLREAREAAGLTQAQLAERANTRQATISQLETGRTRRLDLDVLDRILDALGLQPDTVVVRTPPKRHR